MESKSWCDKSAELIMHVCSITPLAWFISNPGSAHPPTDVRGHVCLGPVDPLKVNLKGNIRKHFQG